MLRLRGITLFFGMILAFSFFENPAHAQNNPSFVIELPEAPCRQVLVDRPAPTYLRYERSLFSVLPEKPIPQWGVRKTTHHGSQAFMVAKLPRRATLDLSVSTTNPWKELEQTRRLVLRYSPPSAGFTAEAKIIQF